MSHYTHSEVTLANMPFYKLLATLRLITLTRTLRKKIGIIRLSLLVIISEK